MGTCSVNSHTQSKCGKKSHQKIAPNTDTFHTGKHFEQNDTRNNSKNIYYGLASDKTPPPMKLLELFEKDLFKIVEKIMFRKINCEFQDKIYQMQKILNRQGKR